MWSCHSSLAILVRCSALGGMSKTTIPNRQIQAISITRWMNQKTRINSFFNVFPFRMHNYN